MASRLLLLISVALCVVDSAYAGEKQIPAGEEMAALQAGDPKDYREVQRLLDRQRLGLLGETNYAKAKLTAAQEQSFQTSNAMKDRQQVLSLDRQMMAERKQWSEQADSKYSRLSKQLTVEDKRPEAPKPQKKRLSTLRISENMEVAQDAELSYKVNRLLEKRKESKAVSWGTMKQESKSLRYGKKKGYSANSPADRSWGDMLKEFGAGRQPQEEQLAPVSGPLSSFSWGEQEWVAKHGPPKPEKRLAMVAQKAAIPKLPDAMDMPEELDGFLNGAGAKPEWSSRSERKGKATNRYLTDLGN